MKIPNQLPLYVQKLIAEGAPIVEEKRNAFYQAETFEEKQRALRELEQWVKKTDMYCVCKMIPFEWRSDFLDGQRLVKEMEESLKEFQGEISFTKDAYCSFCGTKLESLKCSVCGTVRK